MYEEHHFDSYDSGSHTTSCPPLSSSMNSSYSSASSWGDYPVLSTPPSTRRPSFDSVKIEEMSGNTPTPSRTPSRHGSANGFCNMSTMTQKLLNGYPDQDVMFGKPLQEPFMNCNLQQYSGPIYNNYMNNDGMSSFSSYGSQNSLPVSSSQSFGHHGLPTTTPPLDLGQYSPTSVLSSSPATDFVVPSQTTFVDQQFEMSSSPMRPLHFDSPSSEFATSPAGPLRYFMSPTSERDHSPSRTPSRSAGARQRCFQPLESSTVLHRIQNGDARAARKRVKREYILPNNLSVQKQAKRHCTWPGCQGRFQRQEHLKRHMKTHENEVKLPCQFCGKEFGRADNLKSHIKLHMDPTKKSSRTEYFPEARRVYEEMSRKSRKAGSDGSRTD
ncbi:hypothetical protein BP6252_00986 [Coleophoma cylindrospora]|uniref:C2H2-type domain-containing protein n=1 Tax=Coleophoma cylindrospora TaxID=1849047 RepID=A0A3D8SRV1_9HELO|nr:hypothetical protein BP6252_00986 [Coleophoma cylindrospora]